MGKVVEEKKKKKKGRPSLLDLQKRSIKQEQEQEQLQQQKQNSNSNPNPNLKSSTVSSTPVRRSTRRNPNPDPEEDENDTVAAAEDEEELSGRRREKKLKLVLRLPSQLNSASLNSASCGSDSNAEEENVPASHKKRKINAIGDGSGHVDSEKAEKPISGASNQQGTELDGGPATPLPDKKLLVFVLDRLQKKDSYGVFSEPVDPKELPDYHEVIEHPMDFGTVRKNLAGGAYASLEQFEKDVFLICSNAMQYNAPDTIYFKQARSIQELAKKNFENLRQDSDDNEPEPKRRGRPPTKNIKKPLGRPSLERPGSEFSSDATLATGGENTMWSNHDLRKGALISDKSGPADSFGRSLHGTRYSDGNTGWSADQKLERHDEFTGSILKGISLKHAKKPFVLDENRRNTYKQSSSIAVGREPSVLTTFDGEKKQLMPVGLNAEYGYARSLARFASNLGPVAWKIAAKKIEKSLPPGVKFGPGWVGENDVIPPKPLFVPSSTPLSSLPGDSIPCSMDSQEDKPSQKTGGIGLPERNVLSARAALANHPGKSLLTSAAASPLINTANKASGPSSGSTEASIGLNAQSGFSILNSSAGAVRPRPPFQIHQGPTALHPGMNGFNGAYGFNIPTQMGKPMGAARPTGFNLQAPQMLDAISRTTPNFGHPGMGNNLTPEDPKFLEKSTTTNSSSPLLPHPGGEAAAAPRVGPHPQPSWPGLPPQQRQDSVPPDLNVRFQSPGSPSSSKVDSTQPDLALQL
ncbi:hypothetical protein VitviT2T_003266 [Vitis vinifera]|uniref:Bromo domain-containing protein n=1 Tax=Vitis vinifera TaxID=29760 RepID=A0ABY9BKZ9_VITVI|nr:uncharacterized protein LOC100245230 [Vitis vinifera]WJZ83598.1 hypothetical protein VitviT2T_003266 [Vitis vinifera]|eukprot:XP_002279830.1 PREDICTED: uncharacterized protein LOC100245230 [Vitis vinifera]